MEMPQDHGRQVLPGGVRIDGRYSAHWARFPGAAYGVAVLPEPLLPEQARRSRQRGSPRSLPRTLR